MPLWTTTSCAGLATVLDRLGPLDAAIVGEPTALLPCTAQRGILLFWGIVLALAMLVLLNRYSQFWLLPALLLRALLGLPDDRELQIDSGLLHALLRRR